MFKLKMLPVALISAGVLMVAAPARADEVADLKAMVQQLSAEVQELKAQQADTAQKVAAQAAAPAAVAKLPANAILVTASPVPAPLGRNVGAALNPVQNVMSINAAGNSFTLYGDADQYFNYMTSHSQTSEKLQDGGLMKSRIGLIFNRGLGDGYTLKAQLEQSLNLETGGTTNTPQISSTTSGGNVTSVTESSGGRLFDRQAWAGLASPYGEVRFGRQNTAIFYAGNYVDYTERTMGSIVNSFSVPSRYDGDISYVAPRIGGLQLQVHYAVGASNQNVTSSITMGSIAQLGADYINGPWRVGYAGIDGRSTVGSDNVYYHDIYANYDYGRGTIYANFIHSNDQNGALSTVGGNTNATATQSALTITAPSPYYDIYSLSADYKVTPTLRVGGMYGWIQDSATSKGNATGGSVGAYWDAFPNLTVYSLLQEIKNGTTAAFTFNSSAGLQDNFSASTVEGHSITGLAVGALYRF